MWMNAGCGCSTAVPSTATPSTAVPSTATPSTATPRCRTPLDQSACVLFGFRRHDCVSHVLRRVGREAMLRDECWLRMQHCGAEHSDAQHGGAEHSDTKHGHTKVSDSAGPIGMRVAYAMICVSHAYWRVGREAMLRG